MQTTLYNQWSSLKEMAPQIRILEAANHLGVAEGEIVASRVGVDVVKLRPEWRMLLPAIEEFGEIMALTRNEYCVHERKGKYIDTSIGEDNKVGLILSSDIDLRFLLSNWGSVFAVTDKVSEKIVKDGFLHSIQIFNKQGRAVHKVYLMDASNKAAWLPFVERFKESEQTQLLQLEPKPLEESTISDNQLDIEAFREAWSQLKDTHHFAPLLDKYKLARTQALRLVGNEWAEPLAIEFLPEIFQKASAAKQKIMVFVGNDDCVQIHTGLVENLKWVNGWFNVLDPMFDMHLKMEGVAELWRVRKPTTEGVVTSIEVFDAAGNTILQLFGPRRPGIPERKAWRELAESFPSLEG